MNSFQASSRFSSFSNTPSVNRNALFRFASFVLMLVLTCSPAAFAAENVGDENSESAAEVSMININDADVDQLMLVLSGVGEAKAQAIVDWRNANGKFTSVEQLLEVRGIGAAILSKNSHRISI